jgi:hypothetical protein
VSVTDAKNALTFPRIDCLETIDALGLPEPGLEIQLIAGIAFLLSIGRRRATT